MAEPLPIAQTSTFDLGEGRKWGEMGRRVTHVQG